MLKFTRHFFPPTLGADISASAHRLLRLDRHKQRIVYHSSTATIRALLVLALPHEAVRQFAIRLPRQTPVAEILVIAAQEARRLTGLHADQLAWDFTWRDPDDPHSDIAWLSVSPKNICTALYNSVNTHRVVAIIPAADALLASLAAQIGSIPVQRLLLVEINATIIHIQQIDNGRRIAVWNIPLAGTPADPIATLISNLGTASPEAIVLASSPNDLDTEALQTQIGIPIHTANPFYGLENVPKNVRAGDWCRAVGLACWGHPAMANLLPWRTTRQQWRQRALVIVTASTLGLILAISALRATQINADTLQVQRILGTFTTIPAQMSAARAESEQLKLAQAAQSTLRNQAEQKRQQRAYILRQINALAIQNGTGVIITRIDWKPTQWRVSGEAHNMHSLNRWLGMVPTWQIQHLDATRNGIVFVIAQETEKP